MLGPCCIHGTMMHRSMLAFKASRPPTQHPPPHPPRHTRRPAPPAAAALPAGLRLPPASAPSCWVDGPWQHPPHWQASRTVSGSSLCRPHAATSSPAVGAGRQQQRRRQGQQQAARHPPAATLPELQQVPAAEAGDPQRLIAGSRRVLHSACPTSPSPSTSAAALAAAAAGPARAPLPAATATAAAAAVTSSGPGSPQACSGWWES
jgi:hypothetical protein